MKRKIMIKNLYIFCIISFLLAGSSVKSAENAHERVFVYTDKDCYVVGENIWMKFCSMTPDLKPSTLSKVGYIEISDIQQPHLQLKLALKNGSGSGKVRISENIPTGIYELSGYTRIMRNDNSQVIFKRKIAIINPAQSLDPKRAKLKENDIPNIKLPENKGNVRIKIDKNTYQEREKVNFSLESLSQGLSELVISVRRNDSFAFVESVDNEAWLKQVKQSSVTISNEYLPEYEGHIITANFNDNIESNIFSSLSLVGSKICYVPGRIAPDDKTATFYTGEIYGPQEIVTSVTDFSLKETSNQLTILSPYANYIPESLPELQLKVDSNLLVDRYLGAQLTSDSALYQPIRKSEYYTSSYRYNLDQYTRFPTLSETILEFVYTVKISKMNDVRKFRVFSNESNSFTSSNTLVLLDGVPIFDQEKLIDYSPYLIKKMEVFDGRYAFGDRVYDCILFFTTHKQNLPNYQLGQGSLLFKYDFPSLPIPFESPDYSNDSLRNSRKPDFRHTLYWNPEVTIEKGKPVEHSFYTSDLKGNFEIIVEGIDSEGKIISGRSYFEVN